MKHIPVNEPLLDGNEKLYLNKCIDSGWISSEGPFVQEFEQKFAERNGCKYGVAVTNGTAALQCALLSLDLKDGDEVIVPTFTIISCVSAILNAGARPVLVDCDPITFNSTPELIKNAINEHTKAIILVHIYGLPVDADPIIEVSKSKGIKIIEDVAEVIGLDYKNRPCGSLGDISTYSFYPNKHITTGEGGMLLTDDRILAEKFRSLRNLYFQKKKRFVHENIGWNFRMTNLQAAIGLAQLERLDFFIKRKRQIGKLYNEILKDCDALHLPLAKTNYAENIFWVYGVVLCDHVLDNAESIMKKLADENIGTRPFFYPMHLQPVFIKMGLFANECHPHSERLAEKGFYLPSGLAISDENIRYVANKVKTILKK
jgi:perosamine synthetase